MLAFNKDSMNSESKNETKRVAFTAIDRTYPRKNTTHEEEDVVI